MRKRILFLGGNAVQAYAIRCAKSLGHYVISCDYLPENPGHQYADKFLNISTVDQELVLEAARKEKIDGIISFASDVSAPTAAYVAEKLGLPGHPPRSVDILTHKDKFRLFLQANGFATPLAGGYNNAATALKDWHRFKKPLIVKPTDSSGSKGVSKLSHPEELTAAVECALSFSRSKRFIMEEFIEMQGAQLIGDGFSVDGKLAFSLYGDHIFDKKNGAEFAVQGGMFPLSAGEGLKHRIDQELQRALSLLNMGTGSYNIEARLGKDGRVYLMEIGPRSGGNLIPELIKYACNVDLTRHCIWGALGEKAQPLTQVPAEGYWSYYVIHSNKAGTFAGLEIEPEFRRKHLRELLEQVKADETVRAFANASDAVGVAICQFDSRRQMQKIMSDIDAFIKIKLA